MPTVTEKAPRLWETSGTNREIETAAVLLYDAITRMTRGAIYVVTHDQRYLNLLRASAESLKRVMPDLPITVFSQFPVEGAFDHVKIVEPEGDGFYDKARLMLQSPYEQTVFVDTDIYVVQRFDELFTLLDRFDFAATHEEYLSTDWFSHYLRPDIPASYPEFNTGILAYRRSAAMNQLLENWSNLYKTFLSQNPGKATNDQPFFRAAAYYSEARAATLGREYNCKFRGQGYLNGAVKLLHGHVKFKMKFDYMRRVAAVMNASEKPRVYIGGKVFDQKISGRLWGRRKAHKVGSFPEPESVTLLRLKKLGELLKQRGFASLVRRFPTQNSTSAVTRPQT